MIKLYPLQKRVRGEKHQGVKIHRPVRLVDDLLQTQSVGRNFYWNVKTINVKQTFFRPRQA